MPLTLCQRASPVDIEDINICCGQRLNSFEESMQSQSLAQAVQEGQGRGETDNISAVELQSNRRVLYFSDGVMEEMSSSSDSEVDVDVPDRTVEMRINENELPLVPRLRYKVSKIGHNILSGIDYVGGRLASFLGISTPKYASELGYYERARANADAGNAEEYNENWQRNIGGRRGNNNCHNANNRNEVIIRNEPRAHSEGQGIPNGGTQ